MSWRCCMRQWVGDSERDVMDRRAPEVLTTAFVRFTC